MSNAGKIVIEVKKATIIPQPATSHPATGHLTQLCIAGRQRDKLLPPVEKERVGVEDKFAGSLRRQAPGPMIRQSPLCGYRNSGQVSRAEARDDASRSHQLRYPRQSRQNLVLSDGAYPLSQAATLPRPIAGHGRLRGGSRMRGP